MTPFPSSIDQALAHRFGFNFSENKGRILVYIVFLELLRRSKDIYYHSEKKECDFVIKESLDIVEGIQVAYRVNGNDYDRECQELLDAMDSYNVNEGLMLTLNIDKSNIRNNVGIKVLTVWEWFLNLKWVKNHF